MRADNTSVVTLMLDPPGPPRATVLRSRTSQKPQSTVPPPNPPKDDKEPEPEPRTVPQNGLTIMTRYSDVDKPVIAPDTPERLVIFPGKKEKKKRNNFYCRSSYNKKKIKAGITFKTNNRSHLHHSTTVHRMAKIFVYLI